VTDFDGFRQPDRVGTHIHLGNCLHGYFNDGEGILIISLTPYKFPQIFSFFANIFVCLDVIFI